MKCKIAGCHREPKYKSMCLGHYKRMLRYGDPTAGQRSVRGDAAHFVEEIALKHVSDECLIWPYRRDRCGYARMGNNTIVSRLVCIKANGDPPTPKHEAAHSCGRGDLGCVNPRHLVWKTHRANQQDRLKHGTHNRGERHPMAKLTEAEVLEISALKGIEAQPVTAARYGVSRSRVGGIQTGKDWSWLTKRIWIDSRSAAA